MPFGVPVGKDKDSATFRSLKGRAPVAPCRPQPRVHGVVFRPGRFDRTCESERVLAVEVIVRGGRGGKPLRALLDRLFGVPVNKFSGVGVCGVAAYVFEAPVERLHATIVVGGPAAVLVAADFAFEPVHGKKRQLIVYSRKAEEKIPNRILRD